MDTASQSLYDDLRYCTCFLIIHLHYIIACIFLQWPCIAVHSGYWQSGVSHVVNILVHCGAHRAIPSLPALLISRQETQASQGTEGRRGAEASPGSRGPPALLVPGACRGTGACQGHGEHRDQRWVSCRAAIAHDISGSGTF